MEKEEEAAKSLLDRAMSSDVCTVAYMLIDAAKRLNSELDTVLLKQAWLNQAMEKQFQAMKGQ